MTEPTGGKGGSATLDPGKELFKRAANAALPGLYALARSLVRDDAEDLVQETLLRAYRSFGTLRDEAAGTGWMKAIMANIFRDQLRRRANQPEEISVDDVDDFSLFRTLVDEDPFPYSDTLHLDFLGSFSREDVAVVLARIPDIHRVPLVLHYIEGWATKEIARLLELPLGTVLARLHRGRKRFEKEMWLFANEAGVVGRGAVQ